MDNCVLFNTIIHTAAKSTALEHSFTRNRRSRASWGQAMMEKAPSGIPAILLQEYSNSLPEAASSG